MRGAQRQVDDVLRQHGRVEHRPDRRDQVMRAGRAGRLVVDPVAADVALGIARQSRLVGIPYAAVPAGPSSARRLQRRMLQAVEQVVAAACPGRRRRRTRHRTSAGRSIDSGSLQEVVLAERRPCRFPARSSRANASASDSAPLAAVPTSATVSPGLDLQRDPLEQPCAAVVGQRQVDRAERLAERADMLGRRAPGSSGR